MLSIVSSVREDPFDHHLEAERQFLKLVFAFDHINNARYNAYQHVYLSNLKNTNHVAYKELVILVLVAQVKTMKNLARNMVIWKPNILIKKLIDRYTPEQI